MHPSDPAVGMAPIRRPSCPCRCMPDPATELARDHCWPRPFMAGPHVPVAPCTRTRRERYQCVCRASCCCQLRSCCYVRSTAFFFRPCLDVSSEGFNSVGVKTKMIIFDFPKSFSSSPLFLGLNRNGSGNRKNENDNDKNNRKRKRKRFCPHPIVFEDCCI